MLDEESGHLHYSALFVEDKRRIAKKAKSYHFYLGFAGIVTDSRAIKKIQPASHSVTIEADVPGKKAAQKDYNHSSPKCASLFLKTQN